MDSVRLQQLIRRLAAAPGDEAARNEFFRELWPFVYGVTYRKLRGVKGLAEDAAQETFLRLLRTQPFQDLPDADAVRAYVWRTADNVARDYLRELDRSDRLLNDPNDEGKETEIASNETSADERLRLKQWVADRMIELSTADRAILVMLIEGYRLPEIAEANGLTYTAAGARVSRLRQKLRDKLKAE